MAFGAEVANLIVALKLDDSGFTGKLNNAARTLGRMDSGLSRMGRGAGQVGAGLSRLTTVAATLAAGGLGAVVTTAVSFEDAFAGIRKTVDETADVSFEDLLVTLREMARTIPVSFEELAAIGEQGGAMGIAIGAIDEFTQVVALLGETTDITTEDAATALGTLANVLHLGEEDFDNFGSALVDLGNKGASTESQILGIAQRAGSGATLIGLSADATLGWASSLANLGIEVEAGGSALQKFFLESLRNIQDDDTLAVMAETAGTTGEAFKRAFEQDASAALSTFIEGLGDLTEAEQLATLKALGFTDIRITRALLGLAGDTDALTEALDISAAAWEDNTALQTEAAKRFETTRSKLDLLLGNLRDVAFVVGNEVIPILADLSTEFVDFLNEPGTQEGLRDFAKNLAKGIRDLAAELKGTDFSGIIGGMKLAAEIAKGAFDAFRALPQPIQQLAIAALVANKVSGGAVGQIAKGLANIAFGGLQGGIAGIFGGRGTTPANPLFVSDISGGLGGGGGAAGRGGGGWGRFGGFAAGILGTGGVIATIQGGMLSLEDIHSGTREGVIDGMLSQGVVGLITNAVEGPVKELLGVEEGNTAEIIGELKNSTTTQKISDNLLLDEARHNRADLADGTRAIEDRVIGLRSGVEGKLTDLETGLGGKTQIVADRITGLHSGVAAKLERANVLQGNVVDRVAAMRAGMEGKLERANVLLGNINAKPFSTDVTLNQDISVSATLSASQAQTAIQIHNTITQQANKGNVP